MDKGAIEDVIKTTNRNDELDVTVMKSTNSSEVKHYRASNLKLATGGTVEMYLPYLEGPNKYKRVSTELIVSINTPRSTV